MRNLSVFGVSTSHGQTQTHKTHHSPDVGETTTFPLIGYYMLSHGTNTQMSFCPETPKVGTLVILGAYNFMCKPLIEMRSKAKLYPLLKAFQWYVSCHLHIRELRQFLTFSGQESNCQFDPRPFFWP